jgi:hypothetical protein
VRGRVFAAIMDRLGQCRDTPGDSRGPRALFAKCDIHKGDVVATMERPRVLAVPTRASCAKLSGIVAAEMEKKARCSGWGGRFGPLDPDEICDLVVYFESRGHRVAWVDDAYQPAQRRGDEGRVPLWYCMNHSREGANVRLTLSEAEPPTWRATRNIDPSEELLYDYGSPDPMWT